MHAAYGNPNSYLAYRLKQIYETVEWMNGQSSKCPTIITGDFNAYPDSLPFNYLVNETGMETVLRSDGDGDYWTFNRPQNSFYRNDHRCQRLDYVFYRGMEGNGNGTEGNNEREGEGERGSNLRVIGKWKCMETKIIDGDDKFTSFSDHSLISMNLELIMDDKNGMESAEGEGINGKRERKRGIYNREMAIIIEKEINRTGKIKFGLVFLGLLLGSLYLAGAIYLIVASFHSISVDDFKVNATIFTLIILIAPILLSLGAIFTLIGLIEIQSIISSFKEFRKELLSSVKAQEQYYRN